MGKEVGVDYLFSKLDKNKPTILLCTESARVHSGLANSAREIFTKIHAKNKYNICQVGWAELLPTEKVPWLIAPSKRIINPQGRPMMKKGDAHGEETFVGLLKSGLKPDIVFGAGDPWMLGSLSKNPYRKSYHLVSYITVDGAPLIEPMREVYEDADTLVSPTIFGREVIRAAGITCDDVIPYGVDTSVFKPVALDRRNHYKNRLFGLTPNDILITLIGRNQPRKKIPTAIKALYYLKTGNWSRCDLCGMPTLDEFDYIQGKPGKEAKTCKWCGSLKLRRRKPMDNVYLYLHCAISEDVGWNLMDIIHQYFKEKPYPIFLNQRIKFQQGVHKEELAKLYQASDIFTLPTTAEGFGIPLIEAMACGLPLVVTEGHAHTEYCAPAALQVPAIRYCEQVIQQERHHIIPEHYVAALHQMCATNDIRMRLGNQGPPIAREHDWNHIADKWDQLFSRILQDKRQPWQILTEA